MTSKRNILIGVSTVLTRLHRRNLPVSALTGNSCWQTLKKNRKERSQLRWIGYLSLLWR